MSTGIARRDDLTFKILGIALLTSIERSPMHSCLRGGWQDFLIHEMPPEIEIDDAVIQKAEAPAN